MRNFLYLKVQEYIINQIETGQLKPGMKIYSERKLSEKLNISRMSVKNGIDKLVDSKILFKIHGKGTFVSESMNHNGRIIFSKTSPISVKLNNIILGKVTKNIVVSFKLRYNYEKCKKKFKGESDFYELIRIRFSGDLPYCLEKCYFPFSKFKDAIRYDFSKLSLYDYMSHKRKLPINFIQNIEVISDSEINRLIGIDKKEKVFKIEFNGFTEQKEYVEYTESYILLDEVEFNYKI